MRARCEERDVQCPVDGAAHFVGARGQKPRKTSIRSTTTR
jgi:hypothetical protein